MLLQLPGQVVAGLGTVAQDDDGAHRLAANLVGGRDRGGLGDGGVGEQRRLDLEGPDPVAGGDDHVVAAALEPEVAVLVLGHAVAGAPGVARAVQEERRHGRGIDAQLALLDPEPEARQSPSHRSRPHLRAERHAGERARLGLSVAVVDLHAGPPPARREPPRG